MSSLIPLFGFGFFPINGSSLFYPFLPANPFSAVPFIESEKFDPLLPNSCLVSLLNKIAQENPPLLPNYSPHFTLHLFSLAPFNSSTPLTPHNLPFPSLTFH